jgi:hypothetical protein
MFNYKVSRYNKPGFISIISLILVLLVLAGGVWLYIYKIQTPCQKTIYYDFGDFNSKFGITKDTLISTTKKAEGVWEGPFKHNFFQYKPGSAFKINLIYDSRQETSNERKLLNDSINSQKAIVKSLQDQYDQGLKDYTQELRDYNQKVSYWNSRGGAPTDTYNQLNQQKQELNIKKQNLDSLAGQINTKADQVNIDVSKYNQQAGETFHKGEFDGKEINVYEFQGDNELELALAHEFGHSLGLEHINNNPTAIMYPYLNDQDLDNISLTTDDMNALKNICQNKIPAKDLASMWKFLKL